RPQKPRPGRTGIFVETIATLISMSNTMAASRVSSPIINRAPQEISHPPTNDPMISGSGNTDFCKAPGPQGQPDTETSGCLQKEKCCRPKAVSERSRQVRWLTKDGETSSNFRREL